VRSVLFKKLEAGISLRWHYPDQVSGFKISSDLYLSRPFPAPLALHNYLIYFKIIIAYPKIKSRAYWGKITLNSLLKKGTLP